jgi:hypothetical protein
MFSTMYSDREGAEMSKSTPDLAAEWQRLIKEWEAAVSEYRTVAAHDAEATPTPEREAAAQHLADIKRKMDSVIAAGRAERSIRNRGESLIVKTADDLAGEPPDAPDKGDDAST